MRDPIWDAVRYFLGMGGSFLVGRGWAGGASAAEVSAMADLIVQVGAGLVTIGMFVWTIWARWGTVAVPVAVVAEIAAVEGIKIPTVSAAGKVDKS